MNDSQETARRIRQHALRMVHHANASHIGSSLSMCDLLAVLYDQVLRVRPDAPDWPERDRFVISKGHGAAAYYAVLAERGFFPLSWLDEYCDDGTVLSGHVTCRDVPGVEFSTGSLGHGLPVACGMALAAKADHRASRAFVLLSDGECDEGSTWEAALFAPHHKLDNLVAIVDFNKLQSFGTVEEVLDLAPFADKWRAFGWAVREIDGHDHQQIHAALSPAPAQDGKPLLLIAHTVKGKGVSFMEQRLLWHYRAPDQEQLQTALAEIEVGL